MKLVAKFGVIAAVLLTIIILARALTPSESGQSRGTVPVVITPVVGRVLNNRLTPTVLATPEISPTVSLPAGAQVLTPTVTTPPKTGKTLE